MSTQVYRLINEAEAELCRGVRASYWQPVIDSARRENESNEKLGQAFDDQSRELEIACEVMTPEQLTEFRHRAYPTLHPRPTSIAYSHKDSCPVLLEWDNRCTCRDEPEISSLGRALINSTRGK